MGALRGSFALACAVVASGAACGGERATETLPSDDPCRSLKNGLSCMGDLALRCVESKTTERTSCSAKGQTCVDELGCQTCVPRSISCVGEQRYRCSADGQRRDLVETCPEGLWCSAGGCRDLCADARADRSYLGCEYWPVFTANHQLAVPPFKPAVAIGNGNLVPAHVKVTHGGAPDAAVVAELEVAPRSSDTILLDFDDLLQRATQSALVRGGAYHLTSDVPVTVHQFNPLLFQVDEPCPEDVDAGITSGVCNSFTNDASLLFPQESLGPDSTVGAKEVHYLVISRATFVVDPGTPSHSSAGFVAIVAGGTKPVNVRVKVTAFTSASKPLAAEVLPALSPGQELTAVLQPGDVLQLESGVPEVCPPDHAQVTVELRTRTVVLCDPGRDYDLTGSEVIADGPIEVIGGHDCSFVPFDRPACDHLEESMPPVSAWGKSAVLTQPRVAPEASTVIRVMSGADGNTIRFDPPIAASRTLQRGEWMEVFADRPVFVTGSGPLLVGQYLIGQGAVPRYGDPSLSVAVPVDQFRTSYNFVTPATYTANFVDVIAANGESAVLDGKLVEGFVPVGNSGFSVATVPVATPGAHELTGGGTVGLGLVLYGVGSYTSYMLPGGLDLTTLTVVI